MRLDDGYKEENDELHVDSQPGSDPNDGDLTL